MVLSCVDTYNSECSISNTRPMLSYEEALKYIREEYYEEEKEFNERDADFFFIVDIYDIVDNGVIEQYQYICDVCGEV